MAQGFGMLLGTVTMNAKTAQTIASIVVLAFILTGGYFVRGERAHRCDTLSFLPAPQLPEPSGASSRVHLGFCVTFRASLERVLGFWIGSESS